jgi:predicted GNAT superfamily acetyltransferase
MAHYKFSGYYTLRILESYDDLAAVERLQGLIWPGSELDIVPMHMLLAVIHNGGIVIGAYQVLEPPRDASVAETEVILSTGDLPGDAHLVGFVFGFPGAYETPDGLRFKHHSHMMGVLPEARNRGLGFALKRAQWQMVRHQGMDRITWTYDPLLSQNANLNISRLGAVCNTYIRDAYGSMRDALNAGLPSDRFQVDWWVNSQRVTRRLGKHPRIKLDLAHFLAAGKEILNPSQITEDGLPRPASEIRIDDIRSYDESTPITLVEIPADFQRLRTIDQSLALEWRLQTRDIFETLFFRGYVVTDLIYLPGSTPRSFYVLSHGDSTL